MSRAQVLVVEDDSSLLDGIRAILEIDNYVVMTASNGVQALEVLRDTPTPPDLIVSDIMMPHMDGLDLLREVRKEQRWLGIPFIFLTAKSEKVDIQQGKRLGVDDYIVKPFDADDLLIAIESRLNRHRQLDNAHHDAISTIKRNILTILNHEFRTPLTFVVAYADMLNTPEPQSLSETELLSFLKGVGTGASRLRRLIENFILLVELETGDAYRTYEWRKETITDITSVMQNACERLGQTQEIKHQIAIQVRQNIPPFIADREYLTIALIQLLSNAVKFSEKHKPIVVGAHVQNQELHVWVKDEGRGIPSEEIDSIWQSFYQVNRTKHEDPGTGSGLPIVQGIVKMHSGRVIVDSVYGTGSTFTLALPMV